MNNAILNAFADELEKLSEPITERAPAAGAILGGGVGALTAAKYGLQAAGRRGALGALGGTLLGLLARSGGRSKHEQADLERLR